jgi:hypothetical protein
MARRTPNAINQSLLNLFLIGSKLASDIEGLLILHNKTIWMIDKTK